MNRYRMRFAPHVWTPSLSPGIVNWLRPLRHRAQLSDVRITDVDATGTEIVKQQLAAGSGVVIMPNHSSHADPFVIYSAADQFASPLYIMATWHVFHDQGLVIRWLLRKHGCFSVDREANDIGAFRLASGILQEQPQPLVIFPEGEIYHCNDRVTPFREGAAAIAVAAARKARRKIVCIPCAIKYRYNDDPSDRLQETMGALEEAIFWRRREEVPLPDRIYRFADALLAVKEYEYFGHAVSGPLPDRISTLADHILDQVESRHGLPQSDGSIPERVKQARRTIIAQIEKSQDDARQVARLHGDLEDLFVVVQSFSYPGDYVGEKPSIERLAETLDKFEEDVLKLPTASIKGSRNARVRFGEPIEVPGDKVKGATADLTAKVEESVQTMLDDLSQVAI